MPFSFLFYLLFFFYNLEVCYCGSGTLKFKHCLLRKSYVVSYSCCLPNYGSRLLSPIFWAVLCHFWAESIQISTNQDNNNMGFSLHLQTIFLDLQKISIFQQKNSVINKNKSPFFLLSFIFFMVVFLLNTSNYCILLVISLGY